MNFSIRKNLIFSYIALVTITIVMSTVAATFINSRQITARNKDRLQNAFSSVERQIHDDINFLNNKFYRLKGNELFDDIIVSGNSYDMMIDNIITTFSIFPKVRQFLLDFGINQGVDHYGIYYYTNYTANARLMVQSIPNLGGLVIDETKLIQWNPKGYYEKKNIENTSVFPEIHKGGEIVQIEKFNDKIGLIISKELVLPKFGDTSEQHLKEKAGYLLLRNAFSFDLETQNRHLGVTISVFDVNGKLIGGDIVFSDIENYTQEMTDEVITLIDKDKIQYEAVLKPITYLNETIGYIAVSIPKSDTSEQIWQTISVLFLFGIGVVIMVTVIAFIFATTITRPITMLASRAKQINMDNLGDFKTVIPVPGNNELTVLSEAFSSMVRNLLQARYRLDKNLENIKKVAEEGHKISSSSGYSNLQNEVKKSFSVLSDRKINAELVFSGRLFENRDADAFYYVGANDQSNVEVRPRPKELDLSGTNYFDVLDNKEGTCLAQLRLDSVELGKIELKAITPLYRPLLINIANTIRNISMVKEIQHNLIILKQKNQELKNLNLHKDDFLANTSHELRTPLNGIIGISESLLDETSGSINDEQAHNLKLIIQSGKSLMQIINDILDYSKMKHQEIKLDCGKVTLKVVLDEVLKILSLDAKEKNLELKYQVPQRIPDVFADVNRVQQILFNLIGNAIKFTLSGFVSISASMDKEFVTVSIKDTGIGIAAEQLPNLFKPFEQIDGSTEKQFRGTGLGLSISKKLVEMHGGTIKVESIEEFGSVFSFNLPIYKDEIIANETTLAKLHTEPESQEMKEVVVVSHEESPESPEANDSSQQLIADSEIEPETSLDASTILVVDDEIINIQVLTNHFKNKGYRVLKAQDGLSALDLIDNEKIDLVLLDLMMPKMSGYEVCETIRQSYDLNELPVIILTAKNQVSDLIQAYNSGANDYITKPFFKEEILVRVKTHLAIKESVDHLKEVQNLRKEIEKRKLAEQAEFISKRRLIRILDLFEKAIIAIDSDFELLFFNQKAEMLFEHTNKTIKGKNLNTIFPNSDFFAWMNEAQSQNSNTYPGDKKSQKILIGKTASGSSIQVNAHISKVESEEDLCYVMICDSTSSSEITALEGAIKSVGSLISKDNRAIINEVRGIDANLDELKLIIDEDQHGLEVRNAIAEMMFLAVQYWESTTGKTKLDLAEESNLWKVTYDNGSYRTRTLDRYLFLTSLPKRPRWRTAISTAYFVLANCPDAEPMKSELTASRDNLQKLLNR